MVLIFKQEVPYVYFSMGPQNKHWSFQWSLATMDPVEVCFRDSEDLKAGKKGTEGKWTDISSLFLLNLQTVANFFV